MDDLLMTMKFHENKVCVLIAGVSMYKRIMSYNQRQHDQGIRGNKTLFNLEIIESYILPEREWRVY